MIRALPRDVVDRIAAGEVVERPSSVVKELLENAIDARATSIDVTIEGGGLELIRIADDGIGIARDELPLAFASHATSKLVDVDDLFHIVSFGFRGEALSSVAAVSRCRITSSVDDSGAGATLTCRAGELGEVAPAARPRGTVVEVRDLFHNTPARRRFLGATSTEAARCREVCTALSLVHPGLRLAVTVDGRQRFRTEGAPLLRDRIAAVYGADLAEQMTPVAGRIDGLAVDGFVGLPGVARARPRAQQLFVNGRAVADRAVSSAVRNACRDFLPPSLQPAWVLCLTVDPEQLDVNVHPTKAEVRFRERDALFRLVRRAVRDALLAADLAPRVRAEHVSGTPPAGASLVADLPDAPARSTPGPSYSGLPPRPRPSDTAMLPGSAPAPTSGPQSRTDATPSPTQLVSARQAVRFLQIFDTYLVHDSPEGLVLVDQHALHERVLYSRLQRQLTDGKVPSQRLLVPEPVRLTPSEHDLALRMRDELATRALHIDDFGPDTIVVRAIPAVLRNERLADLVRALIDPPDLDFSGMPSSLDRRLFTMACHAAVKAGDPLDEREAAELLKQSAELEHDATCPHGRPTRLVIGRTELERLFKRSGF